MNWDKLRDTLRVEITTENQRLTKTNILKTLASIYDSLGFISPVLLIGKILFRNLCDMRIPWDNEIPEEIENKWGKWVSGLNIKIEIPRSISIRGTITNIDINLFSDANINGVCTIAYAVIYQTNKISQGLITSKSRLAKRNLTISCLLRNLTISKMSANLSQNIKNTINNQNVRIFYAWSDSTVVLHWLKDKREYKVFMSNGVAKIREHSYLKWNYVPIRNNPSDLGSRGCELRRLCEFWWNGPELLRDCKNWPDNDESEIKRKMVKELLATTADSQNPIDTFLNKFTLRKTLRILCWINRFLNNCRKNKVSGPLTADKVLVQRKFLIKREQNLYGNTENFQISRQSLNLKMNQEGIYECHGRIQGDCPVFIPNKSLPAEKVVEETHLQTIHGGVTLTMARARDQCWIPTLRQLVKRIIKRCYGCKRFSISHYPKPSQG